jgi:parvulin-like peptidyl-prolyl isomerase
MPGTNDVEAVVDEKYRPTMRFLLAVIAVAVALGFAVSQAQEFVDARINAKILAGNAVIESQGQRLERLETRVDEIRGAVMEIKADVRVLRDSVNRK